MPGKKSDNLVFFDTRPGDELFHGLSLLGWQGNMHLKDILYPNRFRPENDTDIYTPDTYSWNEFWFTEGKNGMKELFWGAKGEHPGWVAVPLGDATYFIRWYDGECNAGLHARRDFGANSDKQKQVRPRLRRAGTL